MMQHVDISEFIGYVLAVIFACVWVVLVYKLFSIVNERRKLMGARWNITAAELDKKVADGTLKGWKEISKKREKKPKNAIKFPKSVPEGIGHICLLLKEAGIAYETEYEFLPDRKFRFDIAIPCLKVGIEYEGLVATGKKGGHQTKKHYTKDCRKYNLAVANGWRVFRYTYLNYRDFTTDIINKTGTN